MPTRPERSPGSHGSLQLHTQGHSPVPTSLRVLRALTYNPHTHIVKQGGAVSDVENALTQVLLHAHEEVRATWQRTPYERNWGMEGFAAGVASGNQRTSPCTLRATLFKMEWLKTNRQSSCFFVLPARRAMSVVIAQGERSNSTLGDLW